MLHERVCVNTRLQILIQSVMQTASFPNVTDGKMLDVNQESILNRWYNQGIAEGNLGQEPQEINKCSFKLLYQ